MESFGVEARKAEPVQNQDSQDPPQGLDQCLRHKNAYKVPGSNIIEYFERGVGREEVNRELDSMWPF